MLSAANAAVEGAKRLSEKVSEQFATAAQATAGEATTQKRGKKA